MALSTANAPELTQEQVAKLLVQPLEAASKFLACAPTIFDTNSTLRIPKMGEATNPQWHGENEQISEVTPDFLEVVLLKDSIKSIKTITKFSSELARQSVVSLDAALKDRLVKDVASVLDAQFFSAGGDGVTLPKGIFAQPGIQKVSAVGAITLDALLDAQAKAMDAEVDLSRLKWVFRSREFSKLRKLKDGQGRYQLTPDPATGVGYSLFGVPVVVSNRLPDTTTATPTGRALLADFSQIAVARDLAPSVKILDQTFGDFDQLAIRVVTRMDLGVLNAEAVVALEGITV